MSAPRCRIRLCCVSLSLSIKALAKRPCFELQLLSPTAMARAVLLELHALFSPSTSTPKPEHFGKSIKTTQDEARDVSKMRRHSAIPSLWSRLLVYLDVLDVLELVLRVCVGTNARAQANTFGWSLPSYALRLVFSTRAFSLQRAKVCMNNSAEPVSSSSRQRIPYNCPNARPSRRLGRDFQSVCATDSASAGFLLVDVASELLLSSHQPSTNTLFLVPLNFLTPADLHTHPNTAGPATGAKHTTHYLPCQLEGARRHWISSTPPPARSHIIARRST